MPCKYCKRSNGYHDERCPNYIKMKNRYICSICSENIEPYEDYVENNDNEKAHWECINYAKDLLEFLGYEIKEMEDNYD